ncbi:MAG TPA: hypothetical protein VME70_17265, partial [Mycobacteriales bacterium]|nr:hypothetical protein [Mycobacteriales bacterium]
MSPIILLGLVVMWAVVLIPMWLRRHDETEESRSVERFTSAMHTLSRREPADRRYVVMPHRSHSLDVHVSGASASARRGRLAAAFARRAARRARRAPLTAAHRRRRTLLGLVVLAVVTLLAAVLVGGTAIWALQILADVLVAGFLANLVLRARRATPARSTRTARGATARQQVRAPRRPATRPAARTRTARPARPAAEQPVEAAYQHPMVKKR